MVLELREYIHASNFENIQTVVFGSLTGELQVQGQTIGHVLPLSVRERALTHHPYHQTLHLSPEIPLDPRRLEWLEEQRNGKNLELTLKLEIATQTFGLIPWDGPFQGQIGLIDTQPIKGDLRYTVPDTHWREQVLPQLGYGKVIAFELPAVSLQSHEGLKHAFTALEQAQRLFHQGLYDEAAAKCRIALEQFQEQVERGDGSGRTIPKLKKHWETRLGKTTYDWLDQALIPLKDAANKPAHSANNHFDRLGAQMLLMVTAALVSYAARYLEGTGETP
ncbi:MAG: hypothetical protein AUJ55_03430 [Proteobacteria bacterium CG1_02_64_396]|nr:MAG: hypothetical protein AUJ55_03430 [Proteobacteria bacterium CG1_02_64_396]